MPVPSREVNKPENPIPCINPKIPMSARSNSGCRGACFRDFTTEMIEAKSIETAIRISIKEELILRISIALSARVNE